MDRKRRTFLHARLHHYEEVSCVNPYNCCHNAIEHICLQWLSPVFFDSLRCFDGANVLRLFYFIIHSWSMFLFLFSFLSIATPLALYFIDRMLFINSCAVCISCIYSWVCWTTQRVGCICVAFYHQLHAWNELYRSFTLRIESFGSAFFYFYLTSIFSILFALVRVRKPVNVIMYIKLLVSNTKRHLNMNMNINLKCVRVSLVLTVLMSFLLCLSGIYF